MLWKTVDSLTGTDLRSRAVELQQRLKGFSDQDLVSFHRDAVAIFLLLFNPRVYALYCAVFDGEVNNTGLTDFCSNLILSGSSLANSVLIDPDHFAEVTDTGPFNDEYSISVGSVASSIMSERYGEDVAEEMFTRAGVLTFDGMWEELEKQVGVITLVPDWRLVEATMPRVYAKSPHL